MKKNLIALIVSLLFSVGASAQINLVGASVNANGSIDIVKWQVFDSSTVTRYPSGLEAYLFASSAFNAYNSNYYLSGISADTGVLLTFNTASNTASLGNYSIFSNISEIDMSTGKIYTLALDSVGYISVNEYEISTGTETLLGVIIEPGVNGIVADAIGFDSNNGILYYIGVDDSPSICLYGIPVRNPVFSWTKTTLLTTAPGNNITGVNFDNVNNVLYASNAQFDSSGNYTGNWIVEINTSTGEVIERGLLDGFPYYLAGSSSFDQLTGTYLVVGFDTAFQEKMIAFNTLDNSFVASFVPSMVSEIVCDNYSFSRSAYNTTKVHESRRSVFTIFPNPAADRFSFTTIGSDLNSILKIRDMSGREYLSKQIQLPETEISVEFLSKGLYIVTLENSRGTSNQKLIIQ